MVISALQRISILYIYYISCIDHPSIISLKFIPRLNSLKIMKCIFFDITYNVFS
jgi:hypothetical protein